MNSSINTLSFHTLYSAQSNWFSGDFSLPEAFNSAAWYILQSACEAAATHCKKKGKNISKLAMQYSLINKDISSVLVGMQFKKLVEDNVAAAVELTTVGIDEETLAEVEAILKPVKNQTWPSGNN